jgi:hypothetical protein
MGIMASHPGGEEQWLQISLHNVPVKRRMFPKEANTPLRDALDTTLSLALSLHRTSPLAFSASALYVLFPRLLLRPLPEGCQGRFASAELTRRCEMLASGNVAGLLNESHEALTARALKSVESSSSQPLSFSKTTRRSALAGAGEVGRTCKIAFTYGIEV